MTIVTCASLSSEPRAMAPSLTLSAKLDTEPTADCAADARTSWDACAAETRFFVSSTRVLAVRRMASLQTSHKKISPLGHKIDASLRYINYCVNTLLGADISSLNDVAGLYYRRCGLVRHKPLSHHYIECAA